MEPCANSSEPDAVDAIYEKEHGPGKLAYGLNLRLKGLQLMRMTELRLGNFAQADACAIEDKRRRIEELNNQDSKLDSIISRGSFSRCGTSRTARPSSWAGLSSCRRACSEE